MNILPRRCSKYLLTKGVKFHEKTENGTAAVVIDEYLLPESRFDNEYVSLLLILPDGYPDVSPDMFYVSPWIRVRGASDWPSRADAEYKFLDIRWQRWSRHWSDWRPGRDGMQTWLLKVRHALEIVQ